MDSNTSPNGADPTQGEPTGTPLAQGATPSASQGAQSDPATEVLKAKIAELERFCGQLALENALLKKALGKLPLNSDMR